jgi:hypothetical protein
MEASEPKFERVISGRKKYRLRVSRKKRRREYLDIRKKC